MVRLQPRRAVRQPARLAYLEGAEAESRLSEGRGLTGDELERVIGEFPGRR